MVEKAKSAGDPPPYSNRGVTLRETIENKRTDPFVFDAYCASVSSEPQHVLDYLEQALIEAGFETSRVDGPPVAFYAKNRVIVDGDGHRILSVRSGGQNGKPFVECKGAASPVVAGELRAQFPDHMPTRIDSALDLRSPQVFEQFHQIARQFQDRGTKLDIVGAPIDNMDRGTTIYLGSRKGSAFVRIYQKGLKHAEEMGLTGDAIPDALRHWVRVELEVKPPKGPGRKSIRTLTPQGLWGCSPWVRRFAKAALSIDAERVTMTERRESNHERAMRHCAAQYGEHHLEQIERLGLDAYVLDWLERIGYVQKRQEAA